MVTASLLASFFSLSAGGAAGAAGSLGRSVSIMSVVVVVDVVVLVVACFDCFAFFEGCAVGEEGVATVAGGSLMTSSLSTNCAFTVKLLF